MRPLLPARLAAVVVLFASVNALAQATVFTANMTNAGEPGNIQPTNSVTGAARTSSGTATFTLNAARTQLTMTATVNGIDITGTQSADTNDNLGNAHIHAAATGGTTTFPVVWGFFGSPQNNNNPSDGSVVPFPAGQVGGTFTATWDAPEGNSGTNLATQLPNIFAGRSYINFHTTQFPGGEIRGTLTEVPEPSSLLFAVGSVGLLTLRRRKALFAHRRGCHAQTRGKFLLRRDNAPARV
jgi:hypothetical protein